jgi:putative endonuclease
MLDAPFDDRPDPVKVRVRTFFGLVMGVADVESDQPLFFTIETTASHVASENTGAWLSWRGDVVQLFSRGLSRDQGRKEFGRRGEEIAALYLERKGFQILERNYRCKLGEVDLVVEKEKEKEAKILFVEVKTRHATDSVSPLELVPRRKQFHISRVALHYLASKRLQERSADFALLVVDWSREEPQCELIEGIFNLSWGY